MVKFIVVILIINSHADKFYIYFPVLATGDAVSDFPFLFVAGYTLFFGVLNRLDNYYKRRTNRIYPSIFASIITLAIIGASLLKLRIIHGRKYLR